MIDDAIYAVVSSAAERPASVSGGTPIPHAEEKTDYQTLEKIWRRGSNPVEKILSE